MHRSPKESYRMQWNANFEISAALAPQTAKVKRLSAENMLFTATKAATSGQWLPRRARKFTDKA
jgi:hypothetical protein